MPMGLAWRVAETLTPINSVAVLLDAVVSRAYAECGRLIVQAARA